MLQFVIHETRKRLLLPPVPVRRLFARPPAKAGQVLPAGANLDQLKLESLMFDAG
jgi:hypothetical protein